MSNIANLIIWILAVYGTTNIIVFSTLFKPIRDYLRNFKFIGKVVTCILCMGFWVGVFWGTMYWSPGISINNQNYLYPLFDGCIGSSACWLIYLLISSKMEGK